MATAIPTTPGTKRCPGFAGGNPPILPHEAQADLEHFNSNKGSKDGLSSRCRPCGNAYGKAWAAGKRAAAATPAAEPAAEQPAPGSTEAWAAEHAATSGEHFGLNGPGTSARTRCPLCATPAPTEPTPEARYHDELAERAAAGEAEGYSAEVIDGVTYALPINGSATTAEGQAALEATNAAHAAARRKRDADRKRAERAAAKQAAASKA